jgi:hypothetical protein
MAENTMFEYSYKATPEELWRETASRYVNGFAVLPQHLKS